MSQELSAISDVFGALADRRRRAILELLRRGDLTAGRIAAEFSVSRPSISRHLRVLREAELVREHREGRRRVYSLQPAKVDLAAEYLRRFDDLTVAPPPAPRPPAAPRPAPPRPAAPRPVAPRPRPQAVAASEDDWRCW